MILDIHEGRCADARGIRISIAFCLKWTGCSVQLILVVAGNDDVSVVFVLCGSDWYPCDSRSNSDHFFCLFCV